MLLTTVEKELLVLNALVAKRLGAQTVTLVPEDETSQNSKPVLLADMSSNEHYADSSVLNIQYFKPYHFAWTDVHRAAEDLDIQFTTPITNDIVKARFEYTSPVGQRTTVACTVTLPTGDPSMVQVTLLSLLKFYLRAMAWEWDNEHQIDGYGELFEQWFGNEQTKS